MSDRRRQFRREMEEALRVGVDPGTVAMVVQQLARDPDTDPAGLRAALLQYAPPEAGSDEDPSPPRLRATHQHRDGDALDEAERLRPAVPPRAEKQTGPGAWTPGPGDTQPRGRFS